MLAKFGFENADVKRRNAKRRYSRLYSNPSRREVGVSIIWTCVNRRMLCSRCRRESVGEWTESFGVVMRKGISLKSSKYSMSQGRVWHGTLYPRSRLRTPLTDNKEVVEALQGVCYEQSKAWDQRSTRPPSQLDDTDTE
jgi:hypothetical protein